MKRKIHLFQRNIPYLQYLLTPATLGYLFRGLTKHRCSHARIEKPCPRNDTIHGAKTPWVRRHIYPQAASFPSSCGPHRSSNLGVSNCVKYSLKNNAIRSNSLVSVFLKKIPFISEITKNVLMHSHIYRLQWICFLNSRCTVLKPTKKKWRDMKCKASQASHHLHNIQLGISHHLSSQRS